MSLTLDGREGRVLWGYRLAAILPVYTLCQEGAALTVRGTLRTPDAFALSQQPLVFEAPTRTGYGRFAITELQITGAVLTAWLGPKKDVHESLPVCST